MFSTDARLAQVEVGQTFRPLGLIPTQTMYIHLHVLAAPIPDVFGFMDL